MDCGATIPIEVMLSIQEKGVQNAAAAPVSLVLQKTKARKRSAYRAKFETQCRARFSRIYYAPAS
jgi:hypothetical protein